MDQRILKIIQKHPELKSEFEEIYPELRESEDERIRKILIEQMERWHESALENNVIQDIKDSADAITYLERQKTLSELDKYIVTERTKPGFMFNGNDSVSWEELPLSVRKDDYPYYFIGDLDCYPFIVEKQKEQKYYTYEQSKQAAEDCYYDKGYNTEDGGRCHQQSFLWGFEEGVDWCEQHKEQSTELSEEDINNFNRIAAILVEASRVQNWWRTERLITKDEMLKLTDWLKSLRPSWKPSEEQMRAVFDASERNDKLGFILLTLYNDLKKL